MKHRRSSGVMASRSSGRLMPAEWRYSASINIRTVDLIVLCAVLFLKIASILASCHRVVHRAGPQ